MNITDLVKMKEESAHSQTEVGKVVETSEGVANTEVFEEATGLILVELIEYIPDSIVRKTVLKKLSGHVTVSSFDTDEMLTERISPFTTFIQIIEGKAEIIISKKSNMLLCGQSIIIPAHASHVVKANGKFKMLQTVIKSGYEM
jgi:quercetin dioxygenase-like cupin family protein